MLAEQGCDMSSTGIFGAHRCSVAFFLGKQAMESYHLAYRVVG